MPSPVKTVPRAHILIQYILDRCVSPRYEVAKRLNITRKTLYEWEYQRINIRDHMVDQIAAAADYPMDRIPESVRQKAQDEDIKRRRRRDAEVSQAKLAPPGTPANQWVRKPSQMSMSDVDIHRLWVRRALREGTAPPPPFNIMFPTSSISSLPKHMQWVPDPDLIAEARHNMHPYELRYIPAHRIADRHPLGLQITAGWYFFGADGKMMRESDKGKAQARIDKLKADEAKALDEFI